MQHHSCSSDCFPLLLTHYKKTARDQQKGTMPFPNVKYCKQIANSLLLFTSSMGGKGTVFGQEVHGTIFCLAAPPQQPPAPALPAEGPATRDSPVNAMTWVYLFILEATAAPNVGERGKEPNGVSFCISQASTNEAGVCRCEHHFPQTSFLLLFSKLSSSNHEVKKSLTKVQESEPR